MEYREYISESLPWLERYVVLFSNLTSEIRIVPRGKEARIKARSDFSIPLCFQKMVQESAFFGASVFLTRQCNLNCGYCYEKQYFRDQSLTGKMGMQIISWVSEEFQREVPKEFDLFLYGGEPLLNPKLAEILLASFRAICRTYGVRFSSDANSNGLLLTVPLAKKLAEAGLQTLTITIDGPSDVQAGRRGGSIKDFGNLLHNIRGASRYLSIIIRSNIDTTNYHEIGRLLEIIHNEDLLDRVGYTVAVMGQCNLPQCSANNFGHDVSELELDGQLQEVAHYLADLTLKYGMKPISDLTAFVGETCNNTARRSLTFDVDGKIYRSSCAAVSRYMPHCIGSVDKPGLNSKSQAVFAEEIWRRCLGEQCDYLPICQGGCQSDIYLYHMSNASFRCPKKYIRYGLRAYLTYILRLCRARDTFDTFLIKD